MVLKAAIIGCGQIAGGYDENSPPEHILTHAKAYARHPETELVAVSDIDPARAERFARRWGIPKAFADGHQMLEETRPDVVSICTPDENHGFWLKECLSFPVRAVWCEKPFLSDESEGECLIRAYQESGVHLAVNYQRRWDRQLQHIGEDLHSNPDDFYRVVVLYGKGLRHSGSHAIDLLMDWFGLVKDVRALSTLIDFSPADPTVSAWLQFESKAEAHLVGCRDKHYSLWEVDIVGPATRIRLTRAGSHVETYAIRQDPVFPGYSELAPVPTISATDLFIDVYNALDNLVGAISRQEHLRSTGRTALETMKVCNRILHSATAPA